MLLWLQWLALSVVAPLNLSALVMASATPSAELGLEQESNTWKSHG